jgi:hypothetical protein
VNKVPIINGKEYGWADIQFAFLGRPVLGVTAIKYGGKRDRKFIYGVGPQPVAYANGVQENDGSITLLQSEFEAMVRSAGGKQPTELAPFPIIVQYLDESNMMVKDILHYVLITEWGKDIKQGDLNMEITLPFKVAYVQLNAE